VAPTRSESPIITELQQSSDRVRTAASWLIATFAAVAAALIAGSQFSAIGRLDFGWRLGAAALGAGVALSAVALVVWLLFDVMMPSEVAISVLTQEMARSGSSPMKEYVLQRPEVLLGYDSVARLRRTYLRALSRRQSEILAYYDALHAAADEQDPEVVKAKTRAEAADEKLAVIDRTVGYLGKLMSVQQLRELVARRKWQIFGAAIVAAGGLAIFTWAANPPKPKARSAAALQRASLRDATLVGARLAGASLAGAHLERASLVGADLTGADLSNAVLTGADLRGAKLEKVTWKNTICPDGTNSDTHKDGCASHRTPK
jgi:Pentapeptide repeats (8 copies)